MQRVIKFRIWDSAQNKYTNPTINYTDGRWFFFGNVYLLEEKGLILQQFTGLLDKNGKEIYEGDIILKLAPPYFAAGENDEYLQWVDNGKPMKKYYRPVKYDGFTIKPFSVGLTYPLGPKDIEVVGNIFETPEYLK